jgi:hypothetical protein
MEDSRLPGAAAQPPRAEPVGRGLLPPGAMAGVLELWAFLGSFTQMLGLDRVPSIADLEAAFAGPSQPDNITASALVRGLPPLICSARSRLCTCRMCTMSFVPDLGCYGFCL